MKVQEDGSQRGMSGRGGSGAKPQTNHFSQLFGIAILPYHRRSSEPPNCFARLLKCGVKTSSSSSILPLWHWPGAVSSCQSAPTKPGDGPLPAGAAHAVPCCHRCCSPGRHCSELGVCKHWIYFKNLPGKSVGKGYLCSVTSSAYITASG